MTTHQKLTSTFVVLNDKGLHTRPATELVKCASSFKAHISLIYQEFTVNAKSLLGILMLAAARGAKIRVEAEGIDADTAIEALTALAKNKFHVQY
ncbi:MAG: HPr family phosphocarrier protein [Simkaniaceae bacterium]|nr:HPr family phosphocarrier protein [Simkaniaceae bacterium]